MMCAYTVCSHMSQLDLLEQQVSELAVLIKLMHLFCKLNIFTAGYHWLLRLMYT